jgi:hypothetical protein
MRTDQLIRLLATDHALPPPNLRLRLLVAALGGAVVSVVVLLLDYGIRPDLAHAMLSWRVAAKFVVGLALAASGAALALQMAGPRAAPPRAWLILLPAPLLLAAACLGEMATTAPASWSPNMMGRFSTACLLAVPLLSAAPLAGVVWALREGAPAVPAQLGVAAGAMAAGMGAAIYALHCPDDSPLFVALWYSLAATAVVIAGGAAGARLLRW